ncbi:NgoFVII family restriction endonuclease [Clostridiales Family XIII bacterium RF-744-FAT-WT-3]|uniref:NgoFVII family restriction endonuclease n=1 Tax=Baileyella intestinalis TaxID=2606709 RepID=A0A6A8MAF2_9FIRM|nr:restriction endonuclease PLD domain-containing protein [Baileyella intestinalis]MST69700.1 NgoFVII family restriction endonuclease [Baileyella intestinalis]
MELLQSNYPPVKTKNRTFLDTFYDLLSRTETLDIAVGYITSDSLIELKKIAELNNNLSSVNLTIGMHYLERFTHIQYNAARELNDYLLRSGRGEVRLVTPFKYHGKLYSYSDRNGTFAGIVGSNNLGSIVESGIRTYETSFLIDQPKEADSIKKFIYELNRKATKNINDCDINDFNENNMVLEEHENVKKITSAELAGYLAAMTSTSFEIPIKGAEASPQSNLNVFFGKGRVAKNGLVKPRHWYEVELIVPKNVATQPGYPEAKTPNAIFDVVTDDGWKFKCKVSGDYNKNFRSEGDLKILGKWIKGRLENAGVLTVGSPVTNDTLRRYGRSTMTFTKTSKPNTWYLDFGVK